MSEKKAGKDLGVHIHSGGGSEGVAVDDLRARPKAKRAERAVENAAPVVETAAPVVETPATPDDLPLPDAPAPSVEAAPETEAAARAPRGSAKQTMPATPRAKGIPAPDPRLPEIEKALARGDWPAVAKILAPTGDASELPAPLRLVWAVAAKEADAKAGTAVDMVAIEAFAEVLEVGKQSPMALVIAKRTLRRRAWASAPAPSAAVSGVIIVGGLAIGLVVGWIASIYLF